MTKTKLINWKQVSIDYDGIEICPFLINSYFKFKNDKSNKYISSWYFSWSVASGCIWNLNAIINNNYIATLPKINLDYTDVLATDKSKNLTAFIGICYLLKIKKDNNELYKKIKKYILSNINKSKSLKK
jgi:hypothetical protein